MGAVRPEDPARPLRRSGRAARGRGAHVVGRNCENVVDGAKCRRWVPAFARQCMACGSDVSTWHRRRAEGEAIADRMLGFFEGGSKHQQDHSKVLKAGRQRVTGTRLSEPHPANGTRSLVLELDCGHTQRRKPCRKVPMTVKCAICSAEQTGEERC